MIEKIHRLRASLAHLPGVGKSAENKAWRLGVISWDDFRHSAHDLFSPRTARRALLGIELSEAALAKNDVRYFLSTLPKGDRIRAYPLLEPGLLYLDIETTGLDVSRHHITTVVTYDGTACRSFMRHRNLSDLSAHLKAARTLVTFNGTRFDLRFLRHELGLKFPQIHLDLCTILRDRGLRGGLKYLERFLGVTRKGEDPQTGKEALYLWSQWQRGDVGSLHSLLAYNAQDAMSLERVLIATLNLSMDGCPAFGRLPLPLPIIPDGRRLLDNTL